MAQITEYPRITKMKDNDILLVDGPDGTRTILQSDAAKGFGGEIIAVTKSGNEDKVTLNLTDNPIGLATEKDLDDVADALLQIDTASGNPAVITDAKNGTSFKELRVNIEPAQTGTGDPSPENVREISGWTAANIRVSPTDGPTGGQTYSVSFPEEAGTVYGGVLDLTAGTLTVDRAIMTCTSETSITKNSATTTGGFTRFQFAPSPAMIGGTGMDGVCDKLPVGKLASTVPAVVLGVGGGSNINILSSLTDLADFKSWLDGIGGLNIVYPLKTPVVYQLTPRQIAALAGYNVVFADCGPVELMYIKDVKIQDMIAEESDETASKAFVAGEYVIVKDKLYRVTADISVGDELVSGTNVEETTVGEELGKIVEETKEQIIYSDYFSDKWSVGTINSSSGANGGNSTTPAIRSTYIDIPESIIGIQANEGFIFMVYGYSLSGDAYSYLGYWREGVFSKQSGATDYYISSLDLDAVRTAGANVIRLVVRSVPEGTMTGNESANVALLKYLPINNAERIGALETTTAELAEKIENIDQLTDLVEAQRDISEDWHFSFINISQGMGLGSAHQIPNTATIWDPSGTQDLNQKGIWMSDGVHPFKGNGVTEMYARSISAQIVNTPPSYYNSVGSTTPTIWSGRTLFWMGTSIPAGSDPDAGDSSGATYPDLVADSLGATVVNRSRGSSCVRINSSTGEYTGMIYSHFLRALTRTIDECDAIASNWDNIKNLMSGAPSSLSAADLSIMKNHSYENLIMPYLDGTNPMPDLFVIDHGHNDVRPRGIDGKSDLWINPTVQMITGGVLAEDEYMTENNYANLKTALNSTLEGITNIADFAASLNRYCFKGAVNFLITLILRYNPYARIVIISDYN